VSAKRHMAPDWPLNAKMASSYSSEIMPIALIYLCMEENRPRWDVRTSNPGGAVSRSLVGSTPTLFRQKLLRRPSPPTNALPKSLKSSSYCPARH
jgi:hypothetical protein